MARVQATDTSTLIDERRVRSSATGWATGLVRSVCAAAGLPNYIAAAEAELRAAGVLSAIRRRDTGQIFDWLVGMMSLQGISDEVAWEYMRKHGIARHHELEAKLSRSAGARCPKLRSYWHFYDCGYHKGTRTCTEPDHIELCPLPTHRLRNGRLNQSAYSLFLFIRDIAGGDLIGWLDEQTCALPIGETQDNQSSGGDAIISALIEVHGINRKVASMTLAELFIGAGRVRPQWRAAGATMIAIDTLVHNFLHRTGLLGECGDRHLYGAACYAPNGCAAVIKSLARRLDARAFNTDFPSYFPRFVQHAIWRYCAISELNVCNGNNIDDLYRCEQQSCALYRRCARVILQ
jgi:hypothetical protein